ncbi:MAG: hypothetical protein HFG80_14975 [Eubacterium sp.]|jgi:sugar (Glycoside-Pentoside-Hexuronide) transporter|nr:hypothetical protein [Eubacterium sp.]
MDKISGKLTVGKIPFRDKLIYTLSSGFSSNVAVYVFSYYLSYFLIDMRGIPAAIAGTVILGSRIFDTVTDAVIGMLIDRTNFRSGKYRGWIKLGMIPMLVGLPLVFMNLGAWSMTAKIIWTVITYGLYGSVFTTILYTPTNAQLVNMTSDVEERSSIVGWREIFNNLGIMLVSAGFLPLVRILGRGDDDWGFVFATGFIAALAFVFQLWNLMMQKKYELNEDGTSKVRNQSGHGEKISLLQQLKRVFLNRPAVIAVLGTLVMNILMGVKSGLMIYTFEQCFHDRAFFAVVMVFFTIASVVGAMLIQFFVKWFKDSNRALMISMILSIVLNLVYYFMIQAMGLVTASASIHFGALFFILIASGLVQGLHYGLPIILVSNAIDYGEWKNGRSDIGLVYGFNSLAMSLGSAMGGSMTGFILDMVGYVPGAAHTEKVLNGILAGAIIVPVIMTVGQLILHFFYGLTDKKHEQCVAELKRQKNEGSI